MASVSVSNLILFIAAMAVAAGVAGTLVTSVSEVSEAVSEQGTDVSKQVQSEVEVISDPGSDAVYDGVDTLTLLVKNTGTRTLVNDTQIVDVLVDGRYEPDVTIEQVDGAAVWETGEVARLTIDVGSLSSGAHRVVLRVAGDREVFQFVV